MGEFIEKLKELKTNGEMEKNVLQYIVWQLSAMVDEGIAETTARELVEGKFSLSDAVGAIRNAAYKGAISDVDGYREVRRYLHIDGVVTDAEAALFFLRDIPRETILDLISKIKRDAPEVTKPMLDLGLDDLFG